MFEYWNDSPPTHELLAGFVGYKRPDDAKSLTASGDSEATSKTQGNIDDFLAAMMATPGVVVDAKVTEVMQHGRK